MAMELKMINPEFHVRKYTDGGHYYRLWFEGWDGIGNVDEHGNKFFYHVDCDDVLWNSAHAHAHGYSWYFSIMHDDGTETDADLSNTEIEIIIREMMKMIKEEN